MKSAKIKMVVLALLVFSGMSYADNITVSNPTTTKLSNGKLLCEYENGSDSYSYTTSKSSCDYSHVFNADEVE